MRGNGTSSRSVSLVVLVVVAALACASVAVAHDHSSGGLVARQQHQNLHQHPKFVLKPRQTRAAGAGDGTDPGTGGSDNGDQSAQQPSGVGAASLSSSVSSSSSSTSSSRSALITSSPASISSNTQVVSQTSQPGNLISNIGDGLSSALNIPPTSSSVLSQSPAAVTSSTQSSAPVNSVNAPASSPSSNPATQQTTAAADNESVENITLYSTVSAPTTSATQDDAAASASAAAAAEAAKKKDDDSSGLGKSTIIIIVVVASCIGGAIAIWTIIRKIKLSPSSRFNRKLAPIDFDAGRRDSNVYGSAAQGNFATVGSTSSLGHAHSSNNIAGAEAWPVHRSPSMSSEGHGYSNGGLSRQPSSGAGAMLNSRSGSPEGKSDLGHNPAMSEVGYNAFYPSLPPTSHNHNNGFGAPRDGYGTAPTSDYYNPGVGYSASTRRPNY